MLKYSPFSINIALSSIPGSESKDFVKEIDLELDRYHMRTQDYYSSNESENSSILKYLILGNYDIAYLSLQSNHKFSQKLFSISNSADKQHENNSFQVISGMCPVINHLDLEGFFKNLCRKENKKRYVSICNLKLNNKLLIGNGEKYLNAVIRILHRKIKEKFDQHKIEFLIQQSFSWFELTLISFTNDISIIPILLSEIRKLTLGDIEEESLRKELFNNSLYTLIPNSCFNKNNPHFFSDTHTYFGIEYDMAMDSEEEAFAEDELISIMEWEIKPGYLRNFLALLKKSELNPIIDLGDSDVLMIAGKSDFILNFPTSWKVSKYIKVIKHLIENGSDFSKYVRRVRSKVVFSKKFEALENNDHVVFRDYLQKGFLKYDTKIINQDLKRLKVSRNIRYKILKVFHSYSSGIQDSILFNFYLDFPIFINNLLSLIKGQVCKIDDVFNGQSLQIPIQLGLNTTVDSIEQILIEYIKVYEEGFTVRSLDSYQHEEVSDIDLDLNSSVQQIISTFNTIAIDLGQTFYKELNFGPVVNLNLKNTVANIESINYDIYHLSSPEFVIVTMVKEILNYHIEIVKSNPNYERDYSRTIDFFNSTISHDKYLSDLYNAQMIQINYLYIDAIRLIHTFNYDFKLFEYWFWSYNFQNSSLFNTIGTFNDDYLKQEMFRILFLAKLFKLDTKEVTCPVIEIESSWNRYYGLISQKLNFFFDHNGNLELINAFKLLILNACVGFSNNYISVDIVGDDDYSELMLCATQFSSSIQGSMSESPSLLFKIAQTTENLLKRIKYFEDHSPTYTTKLKEGVPIELNKEDISICQLESISHAYIRIIYELNHKKVEVLNRSWADGEPLFNFNSGKLDSLYLVDRMGGVFFVDKNKMQEYYLIRNAFLSTLWNYSLIQKKNIFFK